MKFIKLRDQGKSRVNLDNVVSYYEYDNPQSQYTKFAIVVRHNGGVAVSSGNGSSSSKESAFNLVYDDIRDRNEDLRRIDVQLGL